MRYIFGYMMLALLLSQCASAAPQRSRVAMPPSATQTVPQNYIDSMNRQEERLDQIDSRMVAIETSLKDFKDDSQRTLNNIDSKIDDMSATNIIMKFVLAIVVLAIPTLLGVWFNEYLKRRRSPSTP